jgi:hypothetical protein
LATSPEKAVLFGEKVEQYRRHSDECRWLASNARGEEERRQLMTMAATWEHLAIELERRAKTHKD